MKTNFFNSKVLWISQDFTSSISLYDALCQADIICEIYQIPSYTYCQYPFLTDIPFLNFFKESELSFMIRVRKNDFENAKQIEQYLFSIEV